MTTITKSALCLGFLACGPALATDMYRCDFANGRTVYQGTQCEIGTQQKAIDSKNARREQVRKTLEQERLRKQQQEVAAKTTEGSFRPRAAAAPPARG